MNEFNRKPGEKKIKPQTTFFPTSGGGKGAPHPKPGQGNTATRPPIRPGAPPAGLY